MKNTSPKPTHRPKSSRQTRGVGKAAAFQRRQKWVGWLDTAHECCRDIRVLGGLLAACDDGVIEGRLARAAGQKIEERADRLKEALRQMEAGR
jgi:hypothetical protein